MKKQLLAIAVLALSATACGKKHDHKAGIPARAGGDGKQTQDTTNLDMKSDLAAAPLFGVCHKAEAAQNGALVNKPSHRTRISFMSNMIVESELTYENSANCKGEPSNTLDSKYAYEILYAHPNSIVVRMTNIDAESVANAATPQLSISRKEGKYTVVKDFSDASNEPLVYTH